MSKSTKQSRARYFDKKAKMSDDVPDAYKPAPGDKGKKTKPSQYTKKFDKMYGEKLGKDADMGDYIKDFAKSDSPQFKGKSKEKRKDMAIAAYLSRNETMIDEAIEGLKNKSKKSGISYSILKKVYDRGMAAYKTGHRPGTTAQQWAMARVNSFITKGSGTWGKADKDLADKVRGEAVSPEQQAAIAIDMKKKGKKPKNLKEQISFPQMQQRVRDAKERRREQQKKSEKLYMDTKKKGVKFYDKKGVGRLKDGKKVYD